MKTRKEYDSIGSVNVPVDKYWGASTQRSSKYFDIGDFLVRPIVIKSIAIIKKAAAIVNEKNRDIDKKILILWIQIVHNNEDNEVGKESEKKIEQNDNEEDNEVVLISKQICYFLILYRATERPLFITW